MGLRLYNKMILCPGDILKDHADANIIVANDTSEETLDTIEYLRIKGIKNCINWKEIGQSVGNLDIRPAYLYWMVRDSYKKDLIIYGYNPNGRQLQSILKMLDIDIAYFIDDIAEEISGSMGKRVRPLGNVVHEKRTIKIIVTREKEDETYKLDAVGLKRGNDYALVRKYSSLYLDRKHVIDVNIGHNFLADLHRPGFIEYGKSDAPLIVLLGNSTTDGSIYAVKSWGEILYELLIKEHMKVHLLNGGVISYKSSQELLKFERDVLPMRPYAVIHYTGFVDAFPTPRMKQLKNYPFIHSYQEMLFAGISDWKPIFDQNVFNISNEYTFGVPDERERYEEFMDNIAIMRSVCDAFGIKYYSFLQPCLVTKKDILSRNEQEYLLNTNILPDEDMNYIHEFYFHVKQRVGEQKMTDLTHIFDGLEDVYIDICHVGEQGNQVIAQEIFNVIVTDLACFTNGDQNGLL
ncbi:MAG: hypothetical protein HFI64_12720 [Lachnospiraceae bacterium]|nr:hypothetical protein [Lachnospiraceae bacterium]